MLGGGGSTANAWEIGVIAGLVGAGLDVTAADLIIGTSAGSTTAAQISAARPAELLANILAQTRPRTGPVESDRGRGPQIQAADHLERMRRIISAAQDAADYRRMLGAAAIEIDATSGSSARRAQRRAAVATRLPSQDWPQQAVRIVAVDAHSGHPIVFDRHSGVDLVDAVAASCAGSGAPHRIGDNRYIDGGFRRNENADLAAGYARVLVLSPFGGRSLVPPEWGMHLAAQVEELRERGSWVETIVPDSKSRNVMGFAATVMDPSRRPPSARAGYDQGRALAEHRTEFWR
ncbi:patatin-like phospholipase family protein [Pseudonocardia spinosispora]|uniref:patatin-like phospholipase family protein n=1 Tax=Pseudonocardia spinosispora TaxID=103441 RepID=UPI001FDFAF18|nr:patatin-like phospholipase family protein [Pseudonocardia spinosispora]